jgi:hypothetical protein
VRFGLLDDVAYYGGRRLEPSLALGSQLWPRLAIRQWNHERRFELELVLPRYFVQVEGRWPHFGGPTFVGVGSTNLEALRSLERELVSYQRRLLGGDHRSVQ